MCLWRRTSVHHVRARTPRFASGGDDYLLNLLVESWKVCAIASPAAALAALTAAIVALCTHIHRALLCAAHTHALRPWPSQAVHCCRMRAASGRWGGVRQVANSEVAFCHSFDISCVHYCCL